MEKGTGRRQREKETGRGASTKTGGKMYVDRGLKTRINPDTWSKVLFGSKKQRITLIKEILKHNEMDVYEGEGNYLKLLPFVKEMRTSI